MSKYNEVEILPAGAEPIQMVISDVVMPRMSGRQLLDFVRCERLPVKFVFTSGYNVSRSMRSSGDA